MGCHPHDCDPVVVLITLNWYDWTYTIRATRSSASAKWSFAQMHSSISALSRTSVQSVLSGLIGYRLRGREKMRSCQQRRDDDSRGRGYSMSRIKNSRRLMIDRPASEPWRLRINQSPWIKNYCASTSEQAAPAVGNVTRALTALCISRCYVSARRGKFNLRERERSSRVLDYSPLSTCTVIDFGWALLGLQVYRPESDGFASCTSRKLVVLSPFSVTTETPPLVES